jgi:crotonobetainyl-CoA:carnitine CoA-transferase CaiB-like acyl-CoA transferase
MTTGARWSRRGNRHVRHAPHNIYPAAPDGTSLGADDQWVAIAVESDAEWRRLVTALDGELDDQAAWADAQGRRTDEDTIDEAITQWTASRTAQQAAEHLQSFGVRAAPVLRYDQVLRLPQLWHRGLLTRAASEEVGPRIVAGPWMRLSRTPGRVRWAAANFGAHNGLILRDVLGLDDARVAALYDAGVTSDRIDGLPRPRVAGLSIERQVELGLARGADPDYLAWNAAGPVIPPAGDPPLAWGP